MRTTGATSDIHVANFPAKLLFGFYTEYLAEADFDERIINLEIDLDGKAYARIEVTIKDAKAGLPAIIAVPVFELGADKAVAMDFYASAEGFTRTRIMRKTISAMPVTSTEPPPPSSRSPSVARGRVRRP